MSWANPGLSGLILIVIVLILVFGPSKLPEIGKAFGRSLKEFKDATRGMMDDQNRAGNDTQPQQPSVNVQTAAKVEPIELKEDQPS